MDETQPPEPGPGDQAEPIEPEAIDSRRRLLPVAIVVALLLMAVPVVLWVTSSEPQPVVSVVPNDDASTAESAPEPADLPGIVESGLAPDFDAELLDGGSYRLSDHLANDGRPVFLNLWASWCFPCREEMPAIDALAGAHPEILFLGVAIEDSLSGAKGFAEEIIPQFVVSQGIDLVVMGTVARTGIAGLLMGNTAERLLQRLVCSVLAVKPEGFVSPISLETPP